MKRYLAWIFLLSTTIIWTAKGQHKTVCGITAHDSEVIMNRLLINRAAIKSGILNSRKSNTITYVPVAFHLAARTNGTGRIREKFVLDALCDMNKDFLPANIQFYLNKSSFYYPNNDAIYSVTNESEQGIMQFTRDNSALNIWVVGEIPQLGEGTTQRAGYFNSVFDWIVLNQDEIRGDDFALAHEMGHFFSLPHTFLGWEADPYDPAVHGNPVQARAPDGRATELMDGSNCETAGDGICDTPPDYNFGLLNRECIYDGGAQDPAGTLVKPDDANILTWNSDCDRDEYHFSPQQLQLMEANLLNDQRFFFNTDSRRYLRDNSTPPVSAPVTEMPTVLSPANGSTVPTGQSLVLDWEAADNATHALIEIDLLPTFSFQPIRRSVEGNSVTIEASALQDNRTYYWRILTYNALGTCLDFSDSKTFRVSQMTSTTIEIPGVETLDIIPNPTAKGQEVQLLLETNDGFSAELSLYNTSGQLVKQLGKRTFLNGVNTYQISTEGLNPGIFMLSLQSEKGRAMKRLIVL